MLYLLCSHFINIMKIENQNNSSVSNESLLGELSLLDELTAEEESIVTGGGSSHRHGHGYGHGYGHRYGHRYGHGYDHGHKNY